MTKRALPDVQNFAEPEGFESTPPISGFEHWLPALRIKAEKSDAAVIEILDQIGKDPYTGEGVGPQDVADALKGAGDVVVNINSLGGSFFAGVTIFNLLKRHPGTVTVNVLGIAASAASIVAMAGDQINMGPAAFMMIHNGQGAAVGDRHVMESAMENLKAIDDAIRDLYVARTGKHAASIASMMDAETLMNAAEAIKDGFADAKIEKDRIFEDAEASTQAKPLHARRWADAVFAHVGVPRSQRRAVYAAIKAGPNDPVFAETVAGFAAIREELAGLREALTASTRASEPKNSAAKSADDDTQDAVEEVVPDADLKALADVLRGIVNPPA